MDIKALSEDWCWGSATHFIYRTCGICSVEFLNTTTWGYIYGLIIDPDERRKGIGGVLVNHCEEFIKSRGFNESRLDVEKTRTWVKDWYIRLGYEVYDEDEDLFYLKKNLT